MNKIVLICEIANRRVAMSTDKIRSVIDIEHVTTIPEAPPHVLGLTALRSEALTIVDTRRALGLPEPDGEPSVRAVVTNLNGHSYALLVDHADDVCTSLNDPKPLGGGFGDGWERVAVGMIETERGPALLIDIDRLAEGAVEKAA